jgi:AcrR family transcriptional regulator
VTSVLEVGSSVFQVSPRPRQLSERQLATKEALLVAGLEVLREVGYTNLTLRTVAVRAGATHTTAYAYFASKAHLVAELFYSFLSTVPVETPDPSKPLSLRIANALGGPATRFGEVETLAQAGNAALYAEEPDVALLRAAIGADLIRRIVIASGDDVDSELTQLAFMTFTGAMQQAGFGALGFDEVAGHVERLVLFFETARAAGIAGQVDLR